MKRKTLPFLVALMLLASANNSFSGNDTSSVPSKFIVIGTGAITGVYYPAGGAICRLVNVRKNDHGIRCSVESTGGSVSNLNAIRSKAIDFAIVQSDWGYHAYNGTGFFSDQKPFKELKSLFSLYSETFTVAVSAKSNIKNLDDIVGKRVNFGPQGSGMYATMEVLMAQKGWTKSSFANVTYLQPSEQADALCKGKIDVLIYSAGNPNGVVQEAAQTCDVRIISIDKETIQKLTKANSFYVKSVIPGGMYAGNPNNIETFGVKAVLVTSDRTSDAVAYNITKAVFENLDNFKTLHPVFSSLKVNDMVDEGVIAPFHPGALKYFKEAKLIK